MAGHRGTFVHPVSRVPVCKRQRSHVSGDKTKKLFLAGLSNNSMHRLLKRAGIGRARGNVSDQIRHEIFGTILPIVDKAVDYADHARRKTILKSDVVQALKLLNKSSF